MIESGFMKYGLLSILRIDSTMVVKHTICAGGNNMRNKILSVLLVGLLCLTGCQSGSSSSIKDGTYTASAKGMNGDVKVEVVLSEGKISAVTVLEQNETVGVADPALERLPAEIVESQSVNIDTVSGATMTSNAIINGVKDCIKQAGGTDESFSTAVVKTACQLPNKVPNSVQSQHLLDLESKARAEGFKSEAED